MFELLLQNHLKADSKTARRYARFIKILRRVNEQLPADAPVRQDKDWEEVMNYALLREIRMIDVKKPADENSPTSPARHLAAHRRWVRGDEALPRRDAPQRLVPTCTEDNP